MKWLQLQLWLEARPVELRVFEDLFLGITDESHSIMKSKLWKYKIKLPEVQSNTQKSWSARKSDLVIFVKKNTDGYKRHYQIITMQQSVKLQHQTCRVMSCIMNGFDLSISRLPSCNAGVWNMCGHDVLIADHVPQTVAPLCRLAAHQFIVSTSGVELSEFRGDNIYMDGLLKLVSIVFL